ncbi:MAG: enoyl-[acyl-carrier-protein] reductase FabI [Novosphingobium pentaromativorans]|uniref:Enoyl-[acyl-carrier-protein] reductase [NADH] n=1 Tax=Novosphingobium pentaromativorans TaxID=205844 RepID=A0A2W5NU18_9SPHN|nr:enoyl-ACP reductase FabI [Novosphingobium panipatense]PZQ55539.1 MAG: enoyl-[acyl-carrier-protein] reductase FabI [Novosphingobium pentaromativorans]
MPERTDADAPLRGLIVGMANDQSLAWGCAEALRAEGAELAITFQGEKARPHVEPLARALEAPLFLPLDVTDPQQMEAVFAEIAARWGRLDFVLHSVAFAPKQDLHGRVVDSSVEGFTKAMDVSCHSLIRLARLAEPLMTGGGSILTMSFYGSEKVVPGYGLMGPVKAALESSVRYLADELGPAAIRVNALSTGPVRTRAASGLSHLDELIRLAAEKAPLHRLVTIEQIGHMAAFLLGPKARFVTGQTVYVDSGYNTIG